MTEFPKNDLLNALNGYFIERLEDKSVKRQLAAQWSYMHLFSSIQIGRIVGWKRGLDRNPCVLCVALHDVATIVSGIRADHAAVGARMLPDVLQHVYGLNRLVKPIEDADLHIIQSAVANHSTKGTESERVYDEFTKDVDAFDRHLHGLGTPKDARFRIERVSNEFAMNAAR